ncbi:hypothetical protein ABPG72_017249 [Tetrahymena utriculariae]
MDQFDRRIRSKGSRDEISQQQEEHPSDYKGILNVDSNLQQQHIRQNSNSLIQQQGGDSYFKDQTIRNQNNQLYIYNQLSPSPEKEVQISYEGDDNLTYQPDELISQTQNQQPEDIEFEDHQQQFDKIEVIDEVFKQKQQGPFRQQSRNSREGSSNDQAVLLQQQQQQLEKELINQGEPRSRQNSNFFQNQKQIVSSDLQQELPQFGDEFRNQGKQGKEQIIKKSFEDIQNQIEDVQISQIKECNLDELIIEEGNQQFLDSKDQSYDYSKGSSPDKNLKESTNSGLQNYNSYQQKHRLLQKRSNDSLAVLEQQQQQNAIDNIKPVQSIKYVTYQPTQKQQNMQFSENSFQKKERSISNQDDLGGRKRNVDEVYQNSFEQTNNYNRKLSNQVDNAQEYDGQSQPNLFNSNKQSKKQSENYDLNSDQKIYDYQQRLIEKDQMLEQMKSFTVQLQQALEKQQDHVINLKKENVGLRQQVRDSLQSNQNSTAQIQVCDIQTDQKAEEELQIYYEQKEQQYEIQQENMEISVPVKKRANIEKDVKNGQDDIEIYSALKYSHDKEVEDIKRRFYDKKYNEQISKLNPIEDELYRQVDNLNEIIDKLRKDNRILNEENRSLMQESHRIVQEQKDLKYRMTNEIEILALQNRKLMQSHKLQSENYDYQSRVHELSYKLEILRQENEELSKINSQQLEDIKILLQEKDSSCQKIDELNNLLEQRGSETSRKFEQLKFDLNKEYESKLNLKIQDIHYKSHMQIQELKNKLKQYQQLYPNVNNFNSINQNSLQNPNINVYQNQINNQNTAKNTLSKQPNAMSTPNILNYQGFSINSNNNENNQNFMNDPILNSYSQNQLNNTYNTSEFNQQNKKSSYIQNLPMSRNSSEKDLNEKRVVWEICGILRHEQIETLPRIIADMKDINKNLTKFTDCIIQMVVACHPKDFFTKNNPNRNNLPTLKQSWKWLKQIMEEYMHLKSAYNDQFEKQICQMLNVEHKIDAVSVLSDKLLECTIANRVFKKISRILNLQEFNTFIEFEQAIDSLEKEDMESPEEFQN